MNTKEIDDLLDRLVDPNRVRFLGVFPRDLIPKPTDIDNFPACLIVNSDRAKEPGSHWLAIYYFNPESFEFFDSYGQDPSLYKVPSRRLAPNCTSNHIQVQCLDSNVCGQHCIYFLYERSLGFPMPMIVGKFSPSNLRGNDMFVAHYINKLLHKPIPIRLCKPSSLTPSNCVQISHAFNHFHNLIN